jgi:DNA integrity scanning protein DisA with diadenylate cyclase activity
VQAAKYDLQADTALISSADKICLAANVTYFESQFARALSKPDVGESQSSAQKYHKNATTEIFENIIPQIKIAVEKLVEE